MEDVMNARRGKIALATGAAALLFGGLGSEALAHTDKTPASVSINRAGDDFGGVVSSSKSCEKQRKVSLFRRGDTGALDNTTTNGAGGWTIEGVSVETGNYYVTVAKRVLKSNKDHKHICKGTKSKPGNDVKVRDCDETTLFDGSGSDGSQNIDADDDLEVFVEGESVFKDDDGFAQALPPINLGPVGFGEEIRIVATNGPFGGPVGLDPISVQCSTPGGSGSAVLDGTGVASGSDQAANSVFYDETYVMPTITLTR
jgi:hypothetical protein